MVLGDLPSPPWPPGLPASFLRPSDAHLSLWQELRGLRVPESIVFPFSKSEIKSILRPLVLGPDAQQWSTVISHVNVAPGITCPGPSKDSEDVFSPCQSRKFHLSLQAKGLRQTFSSPLALPCISFLKGPRSRKSPVSASLGDLGQGFLPLWGAVGVLLCVREDRAPRPPGSLPRGRVRQQGQRLGQCYADQSPGT